jgi:hypothetical protein
MARPRHPNKEIEAALKDAERRGWTWARARGHAWGRLRCQHAGREGCQFFIYGTPKNRKRTARPILVAAVTLGIRFSFPVSWRSYPCLTANPAIPARNSTGDT